jgi:L-lysine exporter family protein LysE/ArgO
MSFVQGLILGATLCCTIGPQSLFVLRQGMRGEAAVLVALLCTLSDFSLIAVGIVGADAVAGLAPDVEGIASWAAAGFMLAYGGFALASAHRRTSAPDLPRVRATFAIAAAALAISLLNPQVYLEVVVIVGLAGLHFPAEERWLFGLGVALISPLWFFALVVFGRRIAPWFGRPSVARGTDMAVSFLMIALALGIVLDQVRG